MHSAIRILALAVGLIACAPPALLAAEGTWSPAASMNEARYVHAAAALLDGRVLVSGGCCSSASAEIYDPATNRWTSVAPMTVSRHLHALITLTDGRVLAAGGYSASSGATNIVEIYDPAANTWTVVAPMQYGHQIARGALLPDGRVLIVGNHAVSEIYDPARDAWTQVPTARGGWYDWTALAALPDGRVLAAGGCCSTVATEIFDPAANRWSFAGNLNVARYAHVMTSLGDGRVLVAGGYGGGVEPTAEVWTPETNRWTLVSSMSTPRYIAVAAPRRDGRVLVAGGHSGWNPLNTAELYDPLSNAWIPAASMSVGRFHTVAAPLPGGRVLVMGGYTYWGAVANAEIFGPPNTPPTAEAGPDQTAPGCATCLAIVTLDGSASADADGDALSYTWNEGTAVLATSRDPQKTANVNLTLGTHILTLTVSDGEKTATDTVVITVQDGSAEQAALIAQLQAQVATLGDSNAALQQENNALRDQLTDALARVHTLEGLMSDALRVVEADLRATFSDAQFTIGGATLADRLTALVAAVVALEKGRKVGVYTNLGGRPGGGR